MLLFWLYLLGFSPFCPIWFYKVFLFLQFPYIRSGVFFLNISSFSSFASGSSSRFFCSVLSACSSCCIIYHLFYFFHYQGFPLLALVQYFFCVSYSSQLPLSMKVLYLLIFYLSVSVFLHVLVCSHLDCLLFKFYFLQIVCVGLVLLLFDRWDFV